MNRGRHGFRVKIKNDITKESIRIQKKKEDDCKKGNEKQERTDFLLLKHKRKKNKEMLFE
jgi:hypothetical protein